MVAVPAEWWYHVRDTCKPQTEVVLPANNFFRKKVLKGLDYRSQHDKVPMIHGNRYQTSSEIDKDVKYMVDS